MLPNYLTIKKQSALIIYEKIVHKQAIVYKLFHQLEKNVALLILTYRTISVVPNHSQISVVSACSKFTGSCITEIFID